ncbi:MAG TPA: substrate-binding domain-containing protein [Casimicrobiaceae bacterium]|jgi:molybdate transport system substrate-binding protein
MAIIQSDREGLRGISSMAMRHVLAELTETCERRSGQRVVVEAVGGVDASRRVQAGEPFDFAVLAADAIDALAAAGHVDRDTRTDLAHSAIALAVKAGTPRPDIASERAVRDLIISARSVGYSTGPSGSHLARLFERWGIADAIATRVVKAPPGVPVGAMIARGDVELGFQQLGELMHLPDIDVIGLLPSEIQAITVFSAAICNSSKRKAAAKTFLTFLASPDADAVKRRHGMEPARGSSGRIAIANET